MKIVRNKELNMSVTVGSNIQDSIDAAMVKVSDIDFSKINAKLESHHGISKDRVKMMQDIYCKWLVLHMCYPDAELTPNEILDEYWHAHILDTKAYADDCQKLFGHYLHHYPYFGLEGDADARDAGFELTNTLFKKHFGSELIGSANPCKSTDCR